MCPATDLKGVPEDLPDGDVEVAENGFNTEEGGNGITEDKTRR